MQALASVDLASMAFTHDEARMAAWSPDGGRLLTAGPESLLRLWEVRAAGPGATLLAMAWLGHTVGLGEARAGYAFILP